jgi:hypothetical protein
MENPKYKSKEALLEIKIKAIKCPYCKEHLIEEKRLLSYIKMLQKCSYIEFCICPNCKEKLIISPNFSSNIAIIEV